MAMVASDDQGSLALRSVQTDDVRQLLGEIGHRCERGDIGAALQVLNIYPEHVNTVLDREGNSALHHAVRGGHLALCRELLTRGAEVNASDRRQRTPLHVASEEEHADLALELLFAKADVNVVDGNQQTALHQAVKGSSVEVLKVLVEHGGADMTLKDGSLTTPLMIASGAGKADLAFYLLSQDRSLANAEDCNSWTSLHLAAHGREMRKDRKAAHGQKLGKFGQTVGHLLEAGAYADCLDMDRKTPLHRAACTGNSETAGELMRRGANVNAQDNCRWTPLHYACQEGHLQCAKLLLDAKAEVQRADAPCLVPLAVATMENQVKIAELLMSYNADPNLRSKGLASPMMIARKDPKQYTEVLALFELGWINHAS